MKVRLRERGHNTFDVYEGLNLRGSVWHYHEGWSAFSPALRLVSGFHESMHEAVESLLHRHVDRMDVK